MECRFQRFGTELNPSGFATQSLIGIKRKLCGVSQSLLHKPSLNSDIKCNMNKSLAGMEQQDGS
jgi:hypothetical protein